MQRSSSIYLYVTPAFSLLFQSLRISLSYFVHLQPYLVLACSCVISSLFLSFFFCLSLSFVLFSRWINLSFFCFLLFLSSIFVSFDRIESFNPREKRERTTYFDDNNDNAIMVVATFVFGESVKSIAMTCQDGANAFYDSLKIYTDRVNRDKIKLSSRRSPTVPMCFSFLCNDSWNDSRPSNRQVVPLFFSFHSFSILHASWVSIFLPRLVLSFFPDSLGRI